MPVRAGREAAEPGALAGVRSLGGATGGVVLGDVDADWLGESETGPPSADTLLLARELAGSLGRVHDVVGAGVEVSV